MHARRSLTRRGAATVELAILLPVLAFLFLVAVDYCRLFHYSQIVDNCARNGAMWGSDPYGAAKSPYATVTDAAKADAPTAMQSSMTVSATTYTVTGGTEYEVTVTYPFKTLTSYPWIPSTVTLTRKCRVPVAPATPS